MLCLIPLTYDKINVPSNNINRLPSGPVNIYCNAAFCSFLYNNLTLKILCFFFFNQIHEMCCFLSESLILFVSHLKLNLWNVHIYIYKYIHTQVDLNRHKRISEKLINAVHSVADAKLSLEYSLQTEWNSHPDWFTNQLTNLQSSL